ncbi:hypothetical protein ACFL3F_04505 [Planctomycetota bacterium]
MKPESHDKQLDKTIARAIGEVEPVRFDAQAWKMRYPQHVQQLTARASGHRSIPFWRILMNSRLTRWTGMAALIALAFGLLLFNTTSQTAWALEKTLAALQDVKNIYYTGRIRNHGEAVASTVFEAWAEPSLADPTISGNLRHREGSDHLFIENESENRTVVTTAYAQWGRYVYLTDGINRARALIPNGDLLQRLHREAKNWKEELTMDRTGREWVYVTFEGAPINTARFWRIQIDPLTNLPVKTGIWFDASYQGDPHFSFDDLQYNVPIPEDFFTYEIPAAAQVFDSPAISAWLDQQQGLGVDVMDAQGKSARQVAEAYGQALIAADSQALGRLRPLQPAASLLRRSVTDVEILRVNHINDPGVFMTVVIQIREADDRTRQELLHVEVRELDGSLRGVIVDPLPN